MRTYLAGGFRSGWQDTVIREVAGLLYIDPRTSHLTDVNAYTAWDCAALDQSEMLFAYAESDNPGAWNLAFEIGYARAKGIPIIYVDARSPVDAVFERYSGMLRSSALTCVATLEEGIAVLVAFRNLRCPPLTWSEGKQ